MKTWILSGILVLCLALGFMAGCNENSSRAEQDRNNPNKVGTTEARSDTVITAEVKAKITDDELLDNTDVSTETQNGIVTLTGTVATEAQKARAEEIAKGTQGVVAVNNTLELKPSESSSLKEKSDEAKGDLGDARITSEVKLKFAADDTVKALNIDVDTSNGIVTLNGSVNSRNELEQAVRLAKQVDGVKQVKTNLTVSKQ
jgi:hyperosmotically inducible protein